MTAAITTPPHRRTAHVARGVASLTQCIAVISGVPYALIRFVGNPLPAQWPSMAEMRLAIELRDFSDRLIIGVLAIAVWVCWALTVTSIATHLFDRITNVAHHRPRFIPPAIHRLVGRWIGTAGLIVTMLGRPASASTPDRPLVTVTAPTTTTMPDSAATTRSALALVVPTAATPRRSYTISGRDSLWSIAEATLGDGARWKDILATNAELITDPDVLPDGAMITIPSGSETARSHEVTVRPGDNMWTLTEDHLEQHLGHNPTNAEIIPAWLDVIETNTDTIRSGDADLIYPGEILHLPSIESEGEADRPPDPPVAGAEQSHEAAPPIDVATSSPIVSSVPAMPTTKPDAVPTPATAEQVDRAPWLLGLGLGGVGAATLLAALATKRRRVMRSRQPGDPIPTTTEVQRTLISELRGIATPGRIPAVDRTLRYLSTQAGATGQLPEITIVRVGDNSVELLTRNATSCCPAGFALLDDATLVVHPDTSDDDIDACLDEALLLCPALVSIGADDVGDVLVDLERTGTLVIEAETPQQATDVIAAIAAETGHHPWAKDNTIYAIGLPDHLVALPGITPVDDTEVLIDQLTRTIESLDDDRREIGTHAARLDAAEICPATIILIGPDQHETAERLAVLAVRGSGLGIVTATPVSTATWRLIATGTAGMLEPIGLELSTVATLEPPACTNVADLFNEVPTGRVVLSPEATEIDDNRSADEVIADILRPLGVELTLLDEVPRLEGVTYNGKNAARADEVVAFLVLHGPACPRQVGEALWPGRRNTAEQVSQAVSRTRTLLGDVDGRPRLVPARRNAPYRLEGVGCDWTRFQALTRLAAARPDDELRCLSAALELVKGSPFAGRRERSFEWVGDLGYETTVRIALADAAMRAGEALLETGDPRGAIEAARVGRLAIADHEGLLRVRVAALGATGDKTAARHEVETALQSLSDDDGLLADLEPATRSIFEAVLRPVAERS